MYYFEDTGLQRYPLSTKDFCNFLERTPIRNRQFFEGLNFRFFITSPCGVLVFRCSPAVSFLPSVHPSSRRSPLHHNIIMNTHTYTHTHMTYTHTVTSIYIHIYTHTHMNAHTWLATRSCLCGARSTQSLQKGLRRGLSPLARGSCLCGVSAVLRASRKGCGAGPRLLSWQAQYPRKVCGADQPFLEALGTAPTDCCRSSCVCGRRVAQSLQKGLRRWSAAPVCTRSLQKGRGADCRRSPAAPVCVRQAQCSELPETVRPPCQ